MAHVTSAKAEALHLIAVSSGSRVGRKVASKCLPSVCRGFMSTNPIPVSTSTRSDSVSIRRQWATSNPGENMPPSPLICAR